MMSIHKIHVFELQIEMNFHCLILTKKGLLCGTMLNIEQPRFQGLSSLPPLVVEIDTLVAAGHVTTQNLDGRKICWKGGATGFLIVTLTNLLSTTCTLVPTHPAVLDGEMVT